LSYAAITIVAMAISMNAARALTEREIVAAVQAALPGGTTMATATPEQLQAAIASVVAAKSGGG
jgi:hypothetical protein